MRKLMNLTLALALGAFVLTSCGDNKKKDNSSASETTMETSTDAESTAKSADESDAQAEDADVSNTIELTGNDKMKFNKTSFTVKAGEPIKLTMKNIGKLPAKSMSHDVVVLKPGSDFKDFGIAVAKTDDHSVESLSGDLKDEIEAKTKMLGPGESDEITFTLDEPGEYPFLCTFPGHYMSMNGTITVE